ncbi:MAG: hypothetical protein R3223_06485, partial [Longimicrobiales bacterium]|nr:hypothetical protein [Longimicrobiales bacterium]
MKTRAGIRAAHPEDAVRFGRTALLAAVLMLLTSSFVEPPSLAAQIIPVKTIPLATGDQFLVDPSDRLGMGNVSIAIDDPVGDPFVNPAKAARISETTLIGSPTYYTVSEGNGSGRTLPVSALFSSDGTWYGGVSLAIQEIRGPDPQWGGWPAWLGTGFAVPEASSIWIPPNPPASLLSERSNPNLYLSGILARRLSGGWTLGAGMSRAEIDAVDGVEHLFPGARSLDQDATMTDYRLGLLREGESNT